MGGGRLRDAGVALPPALDDLLARALDPEPTVRPSAEDLGQGLAFAEASLTTSPGSDA